jgi:hypothetical protein
MGIRRIWKESAWGEARQPRGTREVWRKRGGQEVTGKSPTIGDSKTAVWILSCTVLFLFLALASGARSNPVVPPVYHPHEESLIEIAWIALINFPLDMLLFTFFLLVVLKLRGEDEAMTSQTFRRYLGLMLLVVAIIAIQGAMIDYCLVYSWNYFEGSNWVYYDPLLWSIAMLLILASVVLGSSAVLKIPVKWGVLPGVAIALVNPLAWLMIMDTQEDYLSFFWPWLLCPVSLLLSCVIIVLLQIWHKDAFARRNSKGAPPT